MKPWRGGCGRCWGRGSFRGARAWDEGTDTRRVSVPLSLSGYFPMQKDFLRLILLIINNIF